MKRNAQRSLAVLVVCGTTWSCASSPARPQPQPQPEAPPPVLPTASVPPVQPVAAKPATPPDPCLPLGRDEVSEDDTPSLAGAAGRTKAGEWLEARGVSKAAFRSWVRSREPGKLDDSDADMLFDTDDSCQTLKVGDKGEDALLCTLAVRTSIMRYSAVAFVVRNKHIAPVLEAGYALPAMDWPDMRWLDLQLTFSPGGLEADLHDRAKPGAVLVQSPRACHEHFARYLACEASHRDSAPRADVCPQQMDRTGKVFLGHLTPAPPPSSMGGGRVTLRGCAEALPKLDELVKQSSASDPFAAEFRGDRAFAIKSCKARGHYVWKGDRFVRSEPAP